MKQLGVCLTVLALALVTARASVTVSWNTRPAAVPAPAVPHKGVVTAVQGTRVIIRMADGTTRVFTASVAQATELRRLVGTAVQFRTPR